MLVYTKTSAVRQLASQGLQKNSKLSSGWRVLANLRFSRDLSQLSRYHRRNFFEISGWLLSVARSAKRIGNSTSGTGPYLSFVDNCTGIQTPSTKSNRTRVGDYLTCTYTDDMYRLSRHAVRSFHSSDYLSVLINAESSTCLPLLLLFQEIDEFHKF